MSTASARALQKHRDDVVARLIAGESHPRENRFDDPPEIFVQRTAEGLDLLIKHLDGKEGFGALYAGQRNGEIFRLESPMDENLNAARRAIGQDKTQLRDFLQSQVSLEALTEFEHAFDNVTRGLVTRAKHHVRTLFVGDCFIGEILAFLIDPLMREGLSIEPFPINPRDPGQLKATLSGMATKQFDAIFFSPFTHARLAEMEVLMDPKRPLTPAPELDALVSSILDQTRALLDAMANRFECPIFVHNAGMVPRALGTAKAYGRLALTHRARSYAGKRINRWVSDYISLRNSNTFQHLFLIDEEAMVENNGRANLGQFLNASQFQHATVLSQFVAKEYFARICAVGHLLGKKLVICDLDNTLWDGVIGEGAVTHFADRQTSLKHLKEQCGVVLSIASKNEPSNVRFEGGVLGLQDFVAPQISWSAKVTAIAKIKSTLNLQTRHMVFIDDRADERSLVQEAFPDVLTLDACDPHSWRMVDIWAALTTGSSDVDRTRMYQEQSLRDSDLQQSSDSQDGQDVESLRKLGLKFRVGQAQKSDLKRVTELINRTNQWNLTGSRTTFEQVRAWSDSGQAHVLVASAADRFGDMGTVCVAVVTKAVEEASIPVFVLSCRVFGYGVESAMLAEIARRAGIGGTRKRLVGQYCSNLQNHPCRNMYADHGFIETEGHYCWDSAPPLPAVSWAQVEAVD